MPGEKSPTIDADPFWISDASYWMPAHFPVSAWLGHAPFAAWLVDVLRPSSIVELGTHYGFSAFAFAEAAKRLRLRAHVSAVDSWQGDDHAGFYGEAVFDYVRAIVDSDYGDSVELVRGLFSQERRRFDDASVDLLHIDGRHAYEDVVTDYREWRTCVRSGGVILFHDITERELGFGVWRLWEELAEPGRSFSFPHSHGLGVLAVGDVTDPRLSALFAARDPEIEQIRADYAALGDKVTRHSWLETLPAEVERLSALAHERALLVNELSRSVAEQSALVESLRASTSWRITAPLRAVGKAVHRRH